MGKDNQARRRMKAKARRASRSQRSASPYDDSGQWSEERAWAPLSDRDQLEYTVSALLTRVLVGWDERSPTEVDEGLTGLTALCSTPTGRRALVAAVLPMVRDAITNAWRGGWQPLDVHRIVGRHSAAAEQRLLTDAIAHEMQAYAGSTVDPRWAAQLRELDARVWWSRDTSYLLARHELGETWASILGGVLHVFHLVAGLPRMERLIPIPGTASAGTSARPAPDAPVIDERILRRVRALLAQAESTTYPAEAETFTAGAQALMARHSIDAALLAADQPRHDAPHARRIGLDNPYEGPKAMLLDAVASANRCRTVWSRELGFSTVMGFGPDLDAVEVVFTSLLVQATHALTAQGTRTDRFGRSRTRAFRQSFLTAYATRIGERLREVTREQVDAAAHDVGRSSGRALVPLLHARSAEVDAAVDAMFPDLVTRRLGSVTDNEGWHSGRHAADLARLGGHPGLDQLPGVG
ncbi:MAG TPA: DUF2786 domain-containing protein [Candidatus Lustribacter sp.]|nr:DUF2786 domain-containing protein [Candidatus Lustribacter sp.]